MEIEVELQGSEATENSCLNLQDWIRREQIPELHVERKSTPPKSGQMGVGLATILSIILGSSALVQLVKSIHVWLTVRRPKLKVKLKIGASELEIDAQNLPAQDVIIDRALELISRK